MKVLMTVTTVQGDTLARNVYEHGNAMVVAALEMLNGNCVAMSKLDATLVVPDQYNFDLRLKRSVN